jgi:hypothetical protein
MHVTIAKKAHTQIGCSLPSVSYNASPALTASVRGRGWVTLHSNTGTTNKACAPFACSFVIAGGGAITGNAAAWGCDAIVHENVRCPMKNAYEL